MLSKLRKYAGIERTKPVLWHDTDCRDLILSDSVNFCQVDLIRSTTGQSLSRALVPLRAMMFGRTSWDQLLIWKSFDCKDVMFLNKLTQNHRKALQKGPAPTSDWSRDVWQYFRPALCSFSRSTCKERTMNHSSGSYPVTPEIILIDPASSRKLQAYQTIAPDGASLLSVRDPPTMLKRLVDIYESMVRLRCLDETFKQAQRQGKLPFYLESTGEEAAVVASAAALKEDDQIFAQYREHGALLWRGTSMEAMAHQCCGTREDSAKGRQMPVHYGDKGKNFHTISSPLATQLLHSAGFAYTQKLKGESCISACYFGEGAASEGDFHAAMNFASTLGCPVLYICRNNGWAISTPSDEQYKGDGISSRASGYGMDACRVDGGDARAVYNATAMARSRVLETSSPFLLELMVYRLGDHSTSDDSKTYVPDTIRQEGIDVGDPIARLHAYLGGVDSSLVNDTKLAQIRKEAIQEARRAIAIADQEPVASVSTMFDDVYDGLPWNLEQQKLEFEQFRSMPQENQHVPHVT